MEDLQRSTSRESIASRTSSIHLSSAATSSASRKGRSVNPRTTSSHADRASISMPPPQQWSRQCGANQPSRRLSPGSDNLNTSGISATGSTAQQNNEIQSEDSDGLMSSTTARNKSPSAPAIVEFSQRGSKADSGSNRHSFSSVRSMNSAILNGARSSAPSASSSIGDSEQEELKSEGLGSSTTTATSQISVTASRVASNLVTGQIANLSHGFSSRERVSIPNSSLSPLSTSPPQLAPTSVPRTSRSQEPSRPHRKTTNARKPNVPITSSNASPNNGEAKGIEIKRPRLGIIGICALDSKARSKASRNILNKINSKQEFEVRVFGDKVILDEKPENWPLCDYLISFFSEGFPLDKAIEYVRLRKPFSVNDLPMQRVLWDRRLCLMILDRMQVPTPKRVEVTRDGGPRLQSPEMAQHVYERTGVRLLGPPDGTGGGLPAPRTVKMMDDDTLFVDGEELKKPFVEKPVSGEDHNIHIYYSSADGGGGRRLFRKVNNKSSEADPTLKIPRSITETGNSYIYESFLTSEGNEDVKAYTVGPDYCHAETRKSPVVDGIVKRNAHGKEVRYVTGLSPEEGSIARKIAEAFGQRVCGFDLLRIKEKSFVIDVNGWSFVKDNNDYTDRCASILKKLFVREKHRREGTRSPQIAAAEDAAIKDPQNKPSSGHFASLRSILKSPSMSRLHGQHGRTHSEVRSSPTASSQSIPLTAPPSFDKTSVPDYLLPPATTEPNTLPPPAIPSPLLDKNTLSNYPVLDPVPPPATQAQWKLKGMVAVIRHADRTPKQKFKFTFHTKPFVDLLKGHREEVLLVGEAALSGVMDAVQQALIEGTEDPEKLKLLRTSLIKKGGWVGTKVQIKPMFRKSKTGQTQEPLTATPDQIHQDIAPLDSNTTLDPSKDISNAPGGRIQKERVPSTTGMTLSRVSAAENHLEIEKLQLIVKWGGEPTHSARYQARELGETMRTDLFLMNRGATEDLTVYSSSERRVTTSAQIWTAAFLERQEIPPDYITIRKDLLDDSNAAKDEMDKVKKKLKGLLREGNKAPSQFAWPENMPEPFIVVRNVVELMKFHRRVMRQNFSNLYGGAASSLAAAVKSSNSGPASPSGSLSQVQAVNNIQARWCCGEDPELFKERWEKLFAEFCDPEKVDPSKISELHDTMKFDALHNRQFLEWVFTPSASLLEELANGDPSKDSFTETEANLSNSKVPLESSTKPQSAEQSSEKPHHRKGFRRRSEMDRATLQKNASDLAAGAYFHLYTGTGQSKFKTDVRLEKLRDLFLYSKILFDFIGPQEYGITDAEKLEIGLLTSLPLLKAIVDDLEDMQASEGAKTSIYFTKESHIYTLLNCIIEGGLPTKIERNKIPELDYLSTICFELYESENVTDDDEENSFNYSIRVTISPGCHTFEPLDVQLDSKHCIGFAARRSLTAHGDWKQVIDTLRAKFHTVKLPKFFLTVNLSEKNPEAYQSLETEDSEGANEGPLEGLVPSESLDTTDLNSTSE